MRLCIFGGSGQGSTRDESQLNATTIQNALFFFKLGFNNAFNSQKRETMLNHVFSNRIELYNYTHCAYSKSCYLFYGSSVIMSEDENQQGDPEAPHLFAETIQTLVKQLESKINIWYFIYRNLADDCKVVPRDLENILKTLNIYSLSLKTGKCEFCFWDRCNIRPEDTYRQKIKLGPKTTG